jgi:hypothetical protein
MIFVGQIEVDESYFGARRVKGKRSRGARGKTIVFDLLLIPLNFTRLVFAYPQRDSIPLICELPLANSFFPLVF